MGALLHFAEVFVLQCFGSFSLLKLHFGILLANLLFGFLFAFLLQLVHDTSQFVATTMVFRFSMVLVLVINDAFAVVVASLAHVVRLSINPSLQFNLLSNHNALMDVVSVRI